MVAKMGQISGAAESRCRERARCGERDASGEWRRAIAVLGPKNTKYVPFGFPLERDAMLRPACCILMLIVSGACCPARECEVPRSPPVTPAPFASDLQPRPIDDPGLIEFTVTALDRQGPTPAYLTLELRNVSDEILWVNYRLMLGSRDGGNRDVWLDITSPTTGQKIEKWSCLAKATCQERIRLHGAVSRQCVFDDRILALLSFSEPWTVDSRWSLPGHTGDRYRILLGRRNGFPGPLPPNHLS